MEVNWTELIQTGIKEGANAIKPQPTTTIVPSPQNNKGLFVVIGLAVVAAFYFVFKR